MTLYDVRSAITGALIIHGVELDLAQTERARLNAEARVPNPERNDRPTGLHRGVVTTYDVTTLTGIVV